jgi:arylsulfatase A-like enzyme
MLRFCLASLFLLTMAGLADAQGKAKRPNVLIVITDDQGYGDLGFHGNPKIRTPNLDRFARQSVRMKHFYVSPVCSPTRASLLTGRYNYRTGVVDTFNGRSMMYPDEVTLAELLVAAGYRTGIFGKWHLGDCYPLRAIDQGFQEALVLKGGGIGQPSDPPGGSSYFDPVLQHNGKQVQMKGYCSDVFTDAAIDFITHNRDRPFFCYLAFNCPHTPLQVPERYREMYASMNLGFDQFPQVGNPLPGKADQDMIARVYGMVTNIDDNLGRLFNALEKLGVADDTIVIFLTDNGPQQVRWNAGLRGRKGTVYEGGVRVPCFIRWPAEFPGDRDIDPIAAHIDLTPTLVTACGAARPPNLKFDGRSLLSLWKGAKSDWPDRTLYFQWHRGDVPQMYRACAARGPRYRLVQPEAVDEKLALDLTKVRFQLFDMQTDPFEMHDIAEQHRDIVARMKEGYEDWFKDVSRTRGFDPPRIVLGSIYENPTVLTRQDWRVASAVGPKAVGHWEVHVLNAGKYDVAVTLPTGIPSGEVHFRLGKVTATGQAKNRSVVFEGVMLPQGPARVEAWVGDGETRRGAWFVEVRRGNGNGGTH